jgi:hypothetical protein
VIFKSTLEHKVEWYSNETLVDSSTSGNKYEVVCDENGSYLLIRGVNETDQHEYKIIIKNEKETLNFKTYLYVEGYYIHFFC